MILWPCFDVLLNLSHLHSSWSIDREDLFIRSSDIEWELIGRAVYTVSVMVTEIMRGRVRPELLTGDFRRPDHAITLPSFGREETLH